MASQEELRCMELLVSLVSQSVSQLVSFGS